MFSLDEGEETNVGTVRKTRQGFDALAVTTGYDPGRAQKGFASIEEAKAFVEEFHPWDMFGGDFDLVVDPEVRPNPAVPDTGLSGSSERDAEAAGPIVAETAADPAVAEAAAAPPVVAEAAAAPPVVAEATAAPPVVAEAAAAPPVVAEATAAPPVVAEAAAAPPVVAEATAAPPVVAEAAAAPPVVAEAAAIPKPPTEEPGPTAEVLQPTNVAATSTRKPWWRFW